MTTSELKETVEIPASEYETLKRLESLVAELQADNERLSGELQVLLNRLFRKKSERIDPSQLQLFLDQAQAARLAEGETPPAEPAPPKPKKGHGRARLSADLPREVIKLDVPAGDRTCPDCGKSMTPMGIESSERAHVVPAQILVRRYERAKYGCPDGHAVKTAELPPNVIDKGKYEASVYAHVAVAKYADHRVPRRHAQQPKGRRSKSCCMEDEGGPLGIGVQAQVPNHLELLGSRAPVVSVEGTAW